MDLSALPSLSLIKKSREGNERAFNILFERYFSPLYKYALHHTANAPLAEELVMDLMLWLWNRRETLDIKGDMSAYLFRAMKNTIYSHFRKTELSTTSLEVVEIDPAAYLSANGKLAAEEIAQQYKTSLALLTPQRRKIFTLSREEHMTYAEIATYLNLSVKTVEAHVSASLQFMRERFKDYADLMLLALVLKIFL